jgi:hypothetical protein
MGFTKSLMTGFFVWQVVAANAIAGERSALHDASSAPRSGQRHPGLHAASNARTVDPLERVAEAVDGAESSHGKDVAMWRPDPTAPQGPMQVSEAAASDVGGGDRFDLAQNRALGRAYLSRLYWRYHNWPDAIAAYNWGIGKMDAWVKAGRPHDKFLVAVAVYLRRVLRDSGLCNGAEIADLRKETPPAGSSSAAADVQKAGAGIDARPVAAPTDLLVDEVCSAAPDGSGTTLGLTVAANRFYKQLDTALQLALRRAAQDR